MKNDPELIRRMESQPRPAPAPSTSGAQLLYIVMMFFLAAMFFACLLLFNAALPRGW